MPPNLMTRAFYDTIVIPEAQAPYNSVQLKLYYPAKLDPHNPTQQFGMLAADRQQAPFPVVIFMPGMNIDPAGYRWLAEALGQCGIATLCYQFMAEEMPGSIFSSPGLNLPAMLPDTLGQSSSSTVLTHLLDYLQRQQQQGPLQGCLNLEQIILGGHSAGGLMAILNANPEWFSGVCGCFSYGASTAANPMLGWGENSYLPLPGRVPTLLIGGTREIEISNVSGSNPEDNAARQASRIVQTFEQVMPPLDGKNWLVLIQDATHLMPVYPPDDTTGLGFLNPESNQSLADHRNLLLTTLQLFIEHIITGEGSELQNLLTSHPLVSLYQRK
ncbi:hypothetical protein G8770_16960 [Aestuariicella hydrocarbonica]|uniref:Uncharacterized protein n=1 Tax=Pseudomaricurvus hydrocarbonicus TaxID=1470433 RepID=A0A9E5MN00_9GAMM|nr:hypothetical protein [Aestuariicella hydrocarbonica]NHO67241.1 hypothetical protein [Aestuariicella hydrocarbonica]